MKGKRSEVTLQINVWQLKLFVWSLTAVFDSIMHFEKHFTSISNVVVYKDFLAPKLESDWCFFLRVFPFSLLGINLPAWTLFVPDFHQYLKNAITFWKICSERVPFKMIFWLWVVTPNLSRKSRFKANYMGSISQIGRTSPRKF